MQSASHSRSLRWQHALALGIVLVATVRSAWSTLDRYFVGDDFGYVGRFYHLTFREWPQLFVQDWSGGMWGYTLPELRPFAALTFLIDASIWGANPLGYHLTNLLLDTGCACLVGLIVWRLHSTALWLACATALIFAWHPAHAEPVAWITGRVDLLATLAYLAGFFASGCYLLNRGGRRGLFGAWLAYGVGCFSKEFCLTLPLAVIGWWLVFRPPGGSRRWRELALLFGGFVVLAGVFLMCRRIAFGPGSAGVSPLNVFSQAYAERQFDYLRWLLPPLYNFGRDYRPQFVAIAPALIVGTALLSLAIFALWRWKGPSTPAWRAVFFYGFIWYLIATLPMAVSSYFAPRHLYLATAGFAMAIGIVLATSALRRWQAWLIFAVVALFSQNCFDHAITSWRHSAKLSERVTEEILRINPTLSPGEALLLDAPAVHEGAWMWSWSTPFALRAPFMPTPASPVLMAPATYFDPPKWRQLPSLATLEQATGARLISVDEKGNVRTRSIPPLRLQPAAHALASQTSTDQDLAWRQFVSSVLAP